MFVLVTLFILLIVFTIYKQKSNRPVKNKFVVERYSNIPSNISNNIPSNDKRNVSGGEFALIENKKNIKPVVYRYNKWKTI